LFNTVENDPGLSAFLSVAMNINDIDLQMVSLSIWLGGRFGRLTTSDIFTTAEVDLLMRIASFRTLQDINIA